MTLQKQLVKIALLTALTVAVSLLFIFPVPGTNGFVTLAEVGIYTAAFLLGPLGGFWVGALSGGLIDLFSGYPQWIIASVLIHGIQGGIAGYFFRKNNRWFDTFGFFKWQCLDGVGLRTSNWTDVYVAGRSRFTLWKYDSKYIWGYLNRLLDECPS